MTQIQRDLSMLNAFFNVLTAVLWAVIIYKFGFTAGALALLVAIFKVNAYRCYITAKYGIKDA